MIRWAPRLRRRPARGRLLSRDAIEMIVAIAAALILATLQTGILS